MTKVRPPSYAPKTRPTMFSGRTTGAARGVGRTKPTGFGKVSSRVDRTGRVLGTRSGSTGSYRSAPRSSVSRTRTTGFGGG